MFSTIRLVKSMSHLKKTYSIAQKVFTNEPILNKTILKPRLFSNSTPRLNKPQYTQKPQEQDHKNAVWYILSGLVLMIGASYAAVPLFKIFCESQGIDVNTDFKDMDLEKLKQKLSQMKRVENRQIKVKFVASTASDLLWKFEPCQEEIVVAPGETALAFFRANNLTDRPIIGIGMLWLYNNKYSKFH